MHQTANSDVGKSSQRELWRLLTARSEAQLWDGELHTADLI